MFDYKKWNLKELGGLVVLGIILVVVIVLFSMIISPLLVSVLPTVFSSPMSLSEVLLYLILLTMVYKS